MSTRFFIVVESGINICLQCATCELPPLKQYCVCCATRGFLCIRGSPPASYMLLSAIMFDWSLIMWKLAACLQLVFH